MSSSWAIVAIPESDDAVWKLSSEKIPHVTLLFLGDQGSDEQAIAVTEQLRHTVGTSLNQFYLSVKSRGVLGDDEADVLFFDPPKCSVNGSYSSPIDRLEAFRSMLLRDDTIRKLYDSTFQYPQWTPHLTMGYPDSPAKKAPESFLYDTPKTIYFDRIALWVEDFDGPMFSLDQEDYSSVGAAWSDKSDAYLAHHDLTTRPHPRASNLRHHGFGAIKRDSSDPMGEAIFHAASLFANDGDRHKLQHSAVGSSRSATPDQKLHYIQANQALFVNYLEHSLGGRPSEVAHRRFSVATRPDGDWLLSQVDTLAHAGTIEKRIRPELNRSGQITDLHILRGGVGDDDIRLSLMHYGKKGMKWGVRRSRDETALVKNSGIVGKFETGRFESKSAIRDAQSEDSKAASALKLKQETTRVSSMSNAEIRALVERINLETSLAEALVKKPKTQSEGEKFIKTFAPDIAKNAIKGSVQNIATREATAIMNKQFEAFKANKG